MIQSILLGTYTRRESKGIYSITLDTDTEKLSDLTLIAEEASPTYLTKAEQGELFTVTAGAGEGGVAGYQLVNGQYQLVNTIDHEGASPCYVSVDNERQLVFGANYHKGEVTVYRILADGALEQTDSVMHTGSGPHENQEKAHAHYSDLTPDRRLAVCDLGTDCVYTYDVSNEGKLSLAAKFEAAPGTGPRHLVFHPNGKFAYLFGELNSTVVVLAYDVADGSFEAIQTISTLPEDYTAFNGGAAIRISADGRFLYASNRGHNSLVVYQVSAEGEQLETIQFISTEGDFPRDFNLDPSGRFVVAANQNTDNLSLYRRDGESGLLTLIEKDIYAPEAVCVYFEKA